MTIHKAMPNNRVEEFSQHPRRALFKLALPTITAMAVQTTYNMVDTAFVGRLGTESLAALTFSFPLYFILVSINSGMGVGLNSLISRQLGAKKDQEAENSACHGLLIALLTAGLLFIAMFYGASPLFKLLGAQDTPLHLGVTYMKIIVIGNFFMFPAYALHSLFTAQGDTITPMKVQIFSLLVNITLDPFFIFVLKLGVPGAAIATLIAQACALLLFMIALRRRSVLKISWSRFFYRFRIISELATVGIPASLTMLLMAFYIMFLNRFMAHFGTEYVAAFGMASRLESAVVMPLVASSIALLTLTGMFYGASRYTILKETIHFAMGMNILYALAVGSLFFLFPTSFLRVFTKDQHLLDIGAAYMRIEVFTFPLMAVNMTANRAMQGMGLGLPGITINLVRIFVVAIPLAYIFVYLFNLSYLWVAVAMVSGGLAANLTALTWLRSTFNGLGTHRKKNGRRHSGDGEQQR
ncbi:MAG: MATE family efflux transporter [Deltaproteobacteria bacterium]|nr:MATE family efflux transporter [Candidatus Anaeroferrophillus wilburensis]MBN2887773.1 MATE family efflux transporter [Deltaproteobacteria bacterium]